MLAEPVATRPVDYAAAEAFMEARVAAIAAGEAGEMVWLLEHPPLYTAGVSARDEDLLDAGRFPVHRTGRGGQFTYHGPGQRVAYVMLDLNRRGRDVRAFVSLNVEPDLDHFGGIVPCGIQEHGVTSLVDLGVLATMDEADAALKTSFHHLFGATVETASPL